MMVLAMCAYILFPATPTRGQVAIRKVSAVDIETSVRNVCQSATITLPRNISALQQQQLKTLIRRGDPVQVHLGYNGDLDVIEFEGYVVRTGADVPVKIELKDALWPVLQRSFNKAYRNAFVPDVIKDLVGDGFQVQAMEATIGPLRCEQCTVADVLKKLAEDFGLVTYLKNGTVFCGKLLDADARTATYDQAKNIKSSDLKYRVADEVKLKVTAKSVQANGEKLEVEVGDQDGEQRTLTYYGITSAAELKMLATADMEKYKYDGYEGGFKGFGIPVCQHGDRVQLTDAQYPERAGSYLAESVAVSFGPGGFERDIKLAQAWT
jgi:hypothetical protein